MERNIKEFAMENKEHRIKTVEDLTEREKEIFDEVLIIKHEIMKTKKQEAEPGSTDVFEGFNFIADLGKKLQKIHPDSVDCFLFHVLIGSSPDETKNYYFDFPGEDSVYENLLKWKRDKEAAYQELKEWYAQQNQRE